jgi:hypothetical protein
MAYIITEYDQLKPNLNCSAILLQTMKCSNIRLREAQNSIRFKHSLVEHFHLQKRK